MKDARIAHVTSQDGQQGSFTIPDQQNERGSGQEVLITLDNGRQVKVPFGVLRQEDDDNFYLPIHLPSQKGEENILVLPVIEEELDVKKRLVDTGTVRVTKRVHEHEEVVDEPSYQEKVQVDRVTVNKELEEPASIHYEGDELIIPVMEEILVVEKKLILKEEIHVRKERQEVHDPQKVTLRSEEVSVQHIPENKEESKPK